MPGTYPIYVANTQDTQYDIPGRIDIANASDYNDHDVEILTHQSVLLSHAGRITTLETTGVTANVDVAKVGGGIRTLHFINGLFTGYTDG